MDASISSGELQSDLARGGSPLAVDVRKFPAFHAALDICEHSYHINYGAKAAAYVDAFMQNIDWGSVMRRLPESAGAA